MMQTSIALKGLLAPILLAAACAGPPLSVSAKTLPVADREQFDAAVAAAEPGDEIVLADGDYRDLVLHFKGTGAENHPITLRASTPGGAVFGGRSQLIFEGDWLTASGLHFKEIANLPSVTTPHKVEVRSVVIFRKNARHCRITETAIVDSARGVSGYLHMEPGGQHNRVDRCYFSGQTDIGPSIYIEADRETPNLAVLEHSFIGNRRPGRGNRWETVRVGHSEQQYFVSGATLRGNYFTRCDGENEMISNKSTGNRYLHNAFVDNRGELTLRHGDEAWIEGNFFDSPGGRSPGIRVIGSRHVIVNNYFKRLRWAFNIYSGERNPQPRGYTQVKDLMIAFNTLEDCEAQFQLGTSGRPMPPANVQILYNLVQARGGPLLSYANRQTEVHFSGNTMLGGQLDEQIAGISQDRPAMAPDRYGRLLTDVNKLAERADRSEVPQMTADLNGTPRPRTCNIGAIETADAKPLYPLSPEDVGPAWMRSP